MQKTVYTRQYEVLLTLLREARAQAGMTQIQLGKLLDVSQSDVSKAELGSRRLDVIELKLWIEALGGSLPALLSELDSRLAADPSRIRSRQGSRRASQS